MAGKSTKVNVGLEVDVTGTKDVDTLARSLDATAKAAKDDIKVAADVTGTADVAALVTSLDKLPDATVDTVAAATVTGAADVADLGADLKGLPASTSTAVSASTNGATTVTDLATDIAGLPASSSTSVSASTSGAITVSDLATDISALPSSTSTSVSASTSGAIAISDLADDIAALPASTSVSVKASATGTKAVKDLGTDLDTVKRNADDAGAGVSGFASETTGTLGGQFSDGVGMVADFGEQLGNLKGAWKDAGGGALAFGKVFGGVAATIGAGFIVDVISGEIETANRLMEESKGVVQDLTQTLIDNGNQWDINTQKQLISSLQGSETFQTLKEAGAETKDLLDAFYKGDPAAFGHVWDQVARGSKAFDANTISALKAGEAMIDSGGQAQQSADLILEYEKANGLADDTNKDNAASAGKSGDAMSGAGDDAKYATQRTNEFNDAPLKDKSATLTATDNASPKVNAANSKDLTDKRSTLSATDNATPKVNTFNDTPLNPKSVTLDVGLQQARDDIATLNGVQVDVELVPHLDPAALDAEARRNGVNVSTNAYTPAGTPAPAVGAHVGRVATVPVVPASITVNVSGALDPASVARQIRQVLIRGERRTGPIRAGGPRPERPPV